MSLVFSSLVSGMPWGLGSKKASQMCLDHLALVMILKLVSGWASLNFHNFVKNMHISWRMFHLLPFIRLWAPSLRPDHVALLSMALGLCYTSSPASLKAALLSGGFVPSFSSFADYLRVTDMVLSVLDFPVFFFFSSLTIPAHAVFSYPSGRYKREHHKILPAASGIWVLTAPVCQALFCSHLSVLSS